MTTHEIPPSLDRYPASKPIFRLLLEHVPRKREPLARRSRKSPDIGPELGRNRPDRSVFWQEQAFVERGGMSEDALILAVGAISGTSMDGIDVALVQTDGRDIVRPGPGATYPYPTALRAALIEALNDPPRAMRDPLAELEAGVTETHAEAMARLIASAGRTAEVTLAGFHGQTIYHRPQERFTRQLGDPRAVARRLGIPVVARFRHADVAAGGEGAPLVPLYHRALAVGLPQPLCVLNLGGVGNVTYIDGDTVLAFDTGPASALLDDWMLTRRGLAFDDGGALAASGRIDRQVLGSLLDNPYFRRKPPKSLDRNEFRERASMVEILSDADGAATLAAFTIESVAASLPHLPRPALRWLVTGGGRHNRHFMAGMAARLGVPVEPVEKVGWDGDLLEAQCFAYLAVRSTLGLPLSLPTTTGVPEPLPGGEYVAP
jgi:anhydro-N-acetylmuramic acid kinase